MMGGMIWPPVEATASMAPASSGIIPVVFNLDASVTSKQLKGTDVNYYNDLTFQKAKISGYSKYLDIKDKKAFISKNTCPQSFCKHLGSIDSKGQSLICAPNKIVVEVGENKNIECDWGVCIDE